MTFIEAHDKLMADLRLAMYRGGWHNKNAYWHYAFTESEELTLTLWNGEKDEPRLLVSVHDMEATDWRVSPIAEVPNG